MTERQTVQLPILASRTEFCHRLKNEKILVVMAETGSGKSTQLPQYAAEYFHNGLVVCTQPRATTAMTLARRVANEYDGTLEGNSVGFHVGHGHDRTGTDIMFMTDTVLIDEFQMDLNLNRIHVLIIDEVHERSLNTDIVMSIAKLLLTKRKNNFFVVLLLPMIDSTPYLNFFDRPSNQPLNVAHRIYPVSVENLPPPSDCPDYKLIELHVIPTLLRLLPKYAGHTLVFLSGQREIEKALQLFNSNISKEYIALPFYTSLSLEEQNKIFKFDAKRSNQRLVIFCTNVAETAFTIKNIQLVLDTGLLKQFRFDRQHQLNVLETVRISRCSARIRKNRAAYTKRGLCIRLYNDDELKRDDIEPEILRSSLDLILLQLKRSHVNLQTFPFMTKPDSISIHNSLDLLKRLICLDQDSEITERGELFAQLSLNPCLSAFMIDNHSENQRLRSLIMTIVAILSTAGSFFSSHDVSNSLNDNLFNNVKFNMGNYNSDLFYLCIIFNKWKTVGDINPTTKQCQKCHKIPKHSSHICHSCRTQYSFMEGLNNQVLQLIEKAIEFYVKTINNFHQHSVLHVGTIDIQENDGKLIGESLRRYFPACLGHLLVPHLPDEGVRLIETDLRATIGNRSIYVQRAHNYTDQYFVAMSISRLLSGRYIVDRLHQVPTNHLPSSPVQQLLVRENVGWSISNEVRSVLNGFRSETWVKWLVHEYDRISRRLIIWGWTTDRSRLESILQPILTNTHIHTKTIECGPIKGTFQNGLICSSIEIMDNVLRLNLQRVPCKRYEQLQSWLKTKLDIGRHDIKENNFQEDRSTSDDDDDENYEAPPFYIILKSVEVFQRASAKLPSYFVCSQEALALSTTGTHMNEKHAWGRQLVLTIPAGMFITDKEILNRLHPYAVDCRQFGRKNIRAQPGIQLINMARDISQSFIRQILQPIHPLKISLRQTHHDGTGSASAQIFFADHQQRQQAMSILQSDFCQKPVKITVRNRTDHQLVSKSIVPVVSELPGKDPVPLTFLITATNRQTALHLYKEIIPTMESSWQIDGTAAVTVTHPHLYPDLNKLIQDIASQFETYVQQQPVDRKQTNSQSPIRCYFYHGTPQNTTLAASMLAQATAPIIIKMKHDREKKLFEELFSSNIIQNWSNDLNLEVIKKDKSGTWIEIRGPQIQQGQLMRRIADYSDTFDERFRILELNSTMVNFFGRKKVADSELKILADKWINWGCDVNYVSKTKSIIIYARPDTQVSFINSCENEIKKILSKLSADGNIARTKQKCVFCGTMSYSTNTLRICGHAYCRCAANFLMHTFPLQCNDSQCQMKIDLKDLFEIFYEREQFFRLCKKSLQIYLKNNSNIYDQVFCPNELCDGLLKRSHGYQLCFTCGQSVCPSCSSIDDDSHQGRTCIEHDMFHKMGDFLPSLFKAAEKFARDNWMPQIPPIIRIDYNMALVDKCPSMARFNKGVETLGGHLPPDMTRGFFAFHGTAATSIKPICTNGFDPSRRSGQACGIGEYFGVTAAISHGYCRPTTPQGPYAMIIAFLLNCPQLSTRPGFCHVMNNPLDWSYAYNLPVVVVSYGTQSNCQSPLNN